MKFISLQENLKKGLSVVNHIPTKNINLPILNNILLKIKNSNIQLISTNLEIGIVHTIRGKIEEEGEITTDSKIITNYINLLPSDKVTIEEKEEDINIECKNYKTKIKGQSSKDYPLIPEIKKEKPYKIKIKELKKGLSQTLFSTGSSDSRVELSGVLFIFNKDNLTLVSTDSYRLSEKSINLKSEKEEEERIIVPSQTIQEILRIMGILTSEDLKEDEDEVDIYTEENQVLFKFSSTEIVSKLINGQFPDYKQIIPQNFKTEVKVNKQELSRAIKASAIFSKSGINDVNLKIDSQNQKLSLSAASNNIGESNIDLDTEVSGEDNDITLNFRYLIDGLNNIEGEDVIVKIINNTTPCLVRSSKQEEYIYIVMPIKE